MVDVAVLDQLSIIALLMIVFIGLPHGALDGAIAMHLGAGMGIASVLQFLSLYLLCGVIVVLIWYNFSALSLLIFLIISMVHFGWCDANSKISSLFFIQIICHGGIVIFGIVYFHIDEVIPLFDILTQGNSNLPIQVSVYMFYGIIFFTVLYFIFIFKTQSSILRLIELSIIWLIVITFPPLLGFAVYFCFVHTARHVRNIWRKLEVVISPKVIMMQTSILTLLSWLLGLAAYYGFDSGDFNTNIIRIVFIGLAALTVPHMILVDVFFRNK
ncbi:Brp/Blh family beta-carotene 15,15'-dioxygenase [Emcibacteraceae bacterium]|jgi:beta-carotene 15,15'-dioxygenase|nr:Brp/Blh family beta-carotene 15,15'-dioxygenase [Emcibacteraceae bacterium]MDA9180256.1 Brp/Blh family beta-carotene 15,15'-dioxygenase [Emcibacteraceae bacterium]MDA9554438.1 Brp/Blh family beta-carotene 15,15'-dioxygenase [Emcibacteraceae bacterium]MDA9771313.1 Brp/Blh family beta-carotene 15,15'-dioxygenase [Emcibacteraceae bacterium]